MGLNTVAVLVNDYSSYWPDEIVNAMCYYSHSSTNIRENGYFGFGRIISMGHADYTQIVSVQRNTGQALSPSKPASEADLNQLAMILRGHGYTVKRPGRSRGEGPLCWGYAAKAAAEKQKGKE